MYYMMRNYRQLVAGDNRNKSTGTAVQARVLGYLVKMRLKQYEPYSPPYLGVLEEMPLMLETLMLNNLVMACPVMWVV